jgi:hypothetical protein
MSLYWSKGHNDKTGSQAIMNTPSAPEPDFVPDPADAPPEPELGYPSPPGVDPPIFRKLVPFQTCPPDLYLHLYSMEYPPPPAAYGVKVPFILDIIPEPPFSKHSPLSSIELQNAPPPPPLK